MTDSGPDEVKEMLRKGEEEIKMAQGLQDMVVGIAVNHIKHLSRLAVIEAAGYDIATSLHYDESDKTHVFFKDILAGRVTLSEVEQGAFPSEPLTLDQFIDIMISDGD